LSYKKTGGLRPHLIFFVLLISFLPGTIFPQSGNPFEVRQEIKADVPLNDSVKRHIDQSNPLEIVAVPENYIPNNTLVIKKPIPITSSLSDNQNFLFVAFIILLLFLTVLITFNRGLLVNIYRAIISDTYLKLVYRVQHSSQGLSYFLLYLFYFFNAGLFLFLILKFYKVHIVESDLLLYGGCVGIFAIMYLTKHLILRLIGLIFPVEKETSYYNFMIVAFNILLGIAFLPINGLISFSSSQVAMVCIYSGLGFFIIMYAIRQLRGMLMAGNYITFQKFHFIIYLCTIEIAPVLIIAKIILLFLGNK